LFDTPWPQSVKKVVIIPDLSWHGTGCLCKVMGNHARYTKKNPTAIARYCRGNDLWLFLCNQNGYR